MRLRLDVPKDLVEPVRVAHARMQALVDRARATSDPAELGALASEIRRAIADSTAGTGGHYHLSEAHTRALDSVYDAAFPVRDPSDPVQVLAGPWPTTSRTAQLCVLVDYPATRPNPPREALIERAVDGADVRLLRLLVCSPIGHIGREAVVRVMRVLHSLAALDPETIERAIDNDPSIGWAVLGRDPIDGSTAGEPATFLAEFRDVFDALTAKRIAGDGPADWSSLPKVVRPRGLAFVLRALEGRDPHDVCAQLGASDLTDSERAALVEHLAGRPLDDRKRAFALRRPAGDSAALLGLFGLESAVPLLALIDRMSTKDVVEWDRKAVLTAVEQAGADPARALLDLVPSELVSAVLGDNRAALAKRVKHNALAGIAAYGMLPLAPGESVVDRYCELREIGKRGAKLGPNRRHSHANAVEVALAHLAQVAGFPDADRLEWDCEARIANEVTSHWQIAGYTVNLRLDGADPVLTVDRAGKPLKAVPAAVRAEPSYAQVRAQQERLRDQASRMRTGLIERLVATAARVEPEDRARLLALPAGAAMLPALLWQDQRGSIGHLADLDPAGALTVVHPYHLFAGGEWAQWQARVVQQRLVQPVKQVFRELYLLTAAEREAGDASRRFAGQVVQGKMAAQLLSARGWTVHGEYDEYAATRPAGTGVVAALRARMRGYFGMGDVEFGEVRFLTGAIAAGGAGPAGVLPLTEIAPISFSEVMRDLDLVVSVAGTAAEPPLYGPQAASRAQLLAALIGQLRLDRVTIDGQFAVVAGSRATYRVHLVSGSIHREPGGYLCIVPASFGERAHRSLFLPFVDADRSTTVILSKVLLLAEDEKITDRSILAQLEQG